MNRLVFGSTVIWLLTVFFSHFSTNESLLLVSPKVEFIFLEFILSFFIGSLLAERYAASKTWPTYKLSPVGSKLILILIILFIVSQCLILLRIFLLWTGQEYSRVLIYSSHGSSFYQTVYVAFVYLNGLALIFLNFLFIRALLKSNKFYVFFIFFLVLINAVLFNSRGQILSILLIYFLFTLLTKSKKLFSNLSHQFFFTFSIIVIVGISLVRGDNLVNIANNYLLIGPVILSGLVSESYDAVITGTGIINMPLLFSGIDYLVALFFRGIFHFDYDSIGYFWIKLIDQKIVFGANGHHFQYANAFYTLLSEPYIVLGHLGVLITGCFFGGAMYINFVRFNKRGCDYSLLLLSYIWILICTGIFGNAFASPIPWIFFTIIFLFRVYIFNMVEFNKP